MDEKIDLKQVAKENAKKATEKKSDDHFKTTGVGKGDDRTSRRLVLERTVTIAVELWKGLRLPAPPNFSGELPLR